MKAPVVVKIGGAALADAGWLDAFAAAVAHTTEPLLIVHGGGPEISAISERLGIPVEWNGGKRVTTPAVLEAASMVLTGLINKRIVTSLQRAGVDALGVSGVDGALVKAEVAADGALGHVGRVTSVRAELLLKWRAAGLSAVISPISLGEHGEPLNVNADEVAAAVAAAVHAPELLFLTDVPGVKSGGETLDTVSIEEALELVASGVATGGMAVKLKAAVSALHAGVAAVRIGDLETLGSASAGTSLCRSLEAVA